MTFFLEYHKPMRPSISAPVAFFTSLAVALFLAMPAFAQIHGAPTSVTSPGFGGRAINGPPASVTSLGPQGYSPGPPFFAGGNGVHHGHGGGHGHGHGNGDGHGSGGHGSGGHGNGDRHGNGDGHRHHDENSDAVGAVWYPYPVPYAVDAPPEDQPYDEGSEDDADHQGGPTVFDRRGYGERSYVPPVKQAAPAHAPEQRAELEAPPVEPDPPLPATLLVFKDGRSVEVGNYAIQGSTLFDLTPGHRRKILVADLDLEATRRQNDERGVTFQLPQSTKVN
jgi:hypothetical protein